MIVVAMQEEFMDSDHNPIHFKITLHRNRFECWRKVLNWSEADYNVIRQELTKIDWDQLLLGKSKEDMWE